MATFNGAHLELDEYYRVAVEKEFTLEVLVHAPFGVRHLINHNPRQLYPGQLLCIGVKTRGSDGFQVALSETMQYVYRAEANDIRRCVFTTPATRELMSQATGTEIRTTRGFRNRMLLQVTQPLTFRNLAGEPRQFLPRTFVHVGETSLLPNHVVVMAHGAEAGNEEHVPMPHDTYKALLLDGRMIVSTGAPPRLGVDGGDFTGDYDGDFETFVAWEDFHGCGTSCQAVPVHIEEEVQVLCRGASPDIYWCRNKDGMPFVHDPISKSQTKIVKATPPGVPNLPLLGRLQGVFDWSEKKFADYMEAAKAMENSGGPHPLTWGDHRTCEECMRSFSRHTPICSRYQGAQTIM